MSSTDFSRTYQPPGVYINEDESVVVESTGVPPAVLAIVGPARGYQVYVEQVPFGSDAIVLSKQGIDLDTLVLTISSSDTAVPEDEYTATAVNEGADDQDFYVEVVATSEFDGDDGTLVFASYQYTPVDYYTPRRISNFEDVKDYYGEPLNLATGSSTDPDYEHVLSPLSLAAKVAFENNATDLVLVSVPPPGADATTDAAKSTARRTALAAGYAKTATLNGVSDIVGVAAGILPADASGALTDLAAHVNAVLTDGGRRFGIIGFDASVTTAPDALLATSGVKNRRVQVAYCTPGGLFMYSGGTNSSFAVGHTYLAAAYGGRFVSNPVQRALTKQSISSFTGLAGTPLSNALKNQYSQAGIAVAEVDRNGRLTVRHGVTTDNTNVNTREASVVRARDALVDLIATGFSGSDLIGEGVDEDMLFSVKSAMQGFLETATATEMIVGYSGLAVRQQPGDPTVIEVKFGYKPAYPLNYINVSFSVDSTTGTVFDLADAA